MLQKSMNWLFGAMAIGICVIATGCCGPMGCGVGCNLPGSCHDCDGQYSPERPIVHGPIDALRQMRRSLVCGGGCGEVYYGEWMSTPPDAYDPCCGDRFVGGATKCRPFCWQPGMFLGNLYGKRFCDGGIDCGCDDCGGVGYNDCGCDSHGGVVGAGVGCATCDSGMMYDQMMDGQMMDAGMEAEMMNHSMTRVAQPRARRVSAPMTQQQRLAQQQMQRTAQRMRQGTRRTSTQTIRR